MYANSVHKHQKSDGKGQELTWKNRSLDADERKVVGCKWPLEGRSGAVKRTVQ